MGSVVFARLMIVTDRSTDHATRFVTIGRIYVRYDRIRWTILTCAQKLTSSQHNLPHGTEQKKNNEETKTKKNGDAQRNGPVVKSVESVLRPEGSLWWEKFL